ncbi:MAG: hypothetical protein EXR31_04415 [Betaproteobacteria bacterium]|nr:hypothetical protein [Betaproteobacteria bacterium]
MRGFLLACLLTAAAAAAAQEPVAPKEHRRTEDQTFLTYPEWFLVHSPAEYAAFVKTADPGAFPFVGHVRQFWSSYAAIWRLTRESYPFNGEYHTMIMVIGVSTTVEYALRSAYEVVVGRMSEVTRGRGRTPEDEFGARAAQEYVDFIRVQPWYEFDFVARLRGLWMQAPAFGPDMLRKWERRYALTTEWAIKAAYGWLIMKATKASFDTPAPLTAVLLDRLPAAEAGLPEMKVLERRADGSVLVTVPRYYAFRQYAAGLAARGARFIEIAGNRSVIMVTVLAPEGWQAGAMLFEQPILTRPGIKRVALIVPVPRLHETLAAGARGEYEVEHVYDY